MLIPSHRYSTYTPTENRSMMNATATACIRKLAGPLVVALSLFCIALFSTATPAQAQDVPLDECAGGTLFYIAYPDTITNTFDSRPQFWPELLDSRLFALLIYSPVDQQVRIGRVNGSKENVQLSAGQVLEYNTENIGVPLITVINSPQSNVLQVEADFPIVVYGYMGTAFGSEAFTAIPVESWGTEYYAATWPGEVVRNVFEAGEFNYRTEPKEGQSEIMVIAAYDNTRVTIKSTAALRECRNCNSVTLDAGQAYLVQSTVDISDDAEEQPDLAGTEVSANKRIAVISGNPRVMHNAGVRPSLGENSFKSMAIEWLPPREQHGTEFVFMPTWDSRRQRDGLPPEESREAELVRIFGTTPGQTDVTWFNELGQDLPATNTPIKKSEFTQEKIGVAVARGFKTSQPAMAMMSPHAVVRFDGTTTWGANYIGAAYSAWSTYMTELVPREQWISFAPLRAPSWPPGGTEHFLNLVTDTNNQFNVYYRQEGTPRSLFPFNRGRVPGTDLVWGSIPINPGIAYYIEGDSDGAEEDGPKATFFGFAYGSRAGQEQYRPGRTKKDDDKDVAIAGGGETGDDPQVLHPSEYEEDLSLMYGFPLAPSRCVLAPPDEYEIETSMDCEELTVEIRALNANPSGIRSITMLPDSSENARIEFIEPDNVIDLKAQKIAKATFKVVPINPRRNAHAIIIIKDRTKDSKRWRVEYKYEAEDATFDPVDELDFGQVTLNKSSGEKTVVITNPLDRELTIKRLSFVFGTQSFVITRTEPDFKWKNGNDEIKLKSGESLTVWIEITPTEERKFLDSLKVELGCIELTLPIRAATALPCLFVNDLDFGTMIVGETRTRTLIIENKGEGSITFEPPFLDWLVTATEFSIPQDEIDKLAGVVLGPGDKYEIEVTFTAPGTIGDYETDATLWSSAPADPEGDCKEVSKWVASVVEPGPAIEGYDWNERWLSENACTKNTEEDYRTTIVARNAGSTDFEVVSLDIINDPDGVFSIVDAGNVAPGFLMRENTSYDIEVSFDPQVEKDYYAAPNQAQIVMTYTIRIDNRDSVGTVADELHGIGIESYATISDQNFGKIRYTTPGANTVPSSVTIEALGTRSVNLDQVVINTGPHFEFDPTWLANNQWAATAGDGDIETLNPGQDIVVDLIFTPQDVNELVKNATIDIIGDFAHDECSETDSSGALVGEIFTLGVAVEGYDFGTLLTCFESDGVITVRNNSTEPVQISNYTQALPIGQGLTVDPDNTIVLPHVLAPAGDADGNDVLEIPVHWEPNGSGAINANVTITFLNEDGSEEIAVLDAPITGNAETITVNMSIKRELTQFPGLGIQIPITLEDDPARAEVTEFLINLNYDRGMMVIRGSNNGSIRLGDLFKDGDGWNLEILNNEPGLLTVRIYNDAGRFLEGIGEVLVMDFLTYVGEVTETEIPFNVTPVIYGQNQRPCIEVTTSPGQVILDQICGLDFRLIEAINGTKYSVGQASPSIIKSTTDIEFSIGLDAPTRIEVFNHNGDKVGVLVDQHLDPGTYTVTWDARSLPSGKYFYRITSGHWTGTNEMIIQK